MFKPTATTNFTVRCVFANSLLSLDRAKTSLPAPRWGSIASYINASDGSIPLSDLDSHICKWSHRVS